MELRMATAMSLSLHSKLEKVDELLESIQEEQWADEEAAGQDDTSFDRPTDNNDQCGLSLLDQVLAMILGACPPPDGTALAEHICHLEKEHRSILEEWLTHFGRLPPALFGSEEAQQDDKEWVPNRERAEPIANESVQENHQSPETLRAALGILNNNEHSWDTKDEASGNQAEIPPLKPRIVGFRPGGRL
jgi:restriction endonuclease S subunit